MPAVLLALLLLLPGVARPAQTPAAAFAELPPISDVSLSPDGTKAIVMRHLEDTYHLTVFDLEARRGQLAMAANPEEFRFNWCRWANNERIVCSILSYGTLRAGDAGLGTRWYRDGRTIFTRLMAVNADGSNVLQLVPEPRSRLGDDLQWNSPNQDDVISWMRGDDKHVLVQLARDDQMYPSVYRLNIYDNRMKRVRRHSKRVNQWFADRRGEVRFAAGVDADDGEVHAYRIDGSGLEKIDISALGGFEQPDPIGFTADGSGVYVAADVGNDTTGIHEVDLQTGTVRKTLARDPDYDIFGGLALHRGTGEPLFISYYRDELTYVWFDDRLRDIHRAVQAALPGTPARVFLVSMDNAANRFVFRSEGNRTRPRYFLYDHKASSLQLMAEAYRNVETVARPELVSYPSRDGVDIPAILTRPEGAAGPLPTVILPHGGPYARDVLRFDYWAQLMADRGYAVLQPNFRGSSGYGNAWLKTGFDEWGLRMQDDVIDGLDWMVREGITDPKRTCIVGGSYGGYVALVAAFKTPEKFRCAVSFAGVTNLPDLVARLRNFRFGQLTIARIQGGKSRVDNSPLQQAGKIDLPLLIVHGDVDRSVMIEQSRDFVAKLEQLGKPHTYIEQANGDHFLSLQSHRTEFIEALDAFLAEHLK